MSNSDTPRTDALWDPDNYSLMESHARTLERELASTRDAALEQAAELCAALFFDHYDHSQRKVGAQECAEAIRALKTKGPK